MEDIVYLLLIVSLVLMLLGIIKNSTSHDRNNKKIFIPIVVPIG